ncbi:MAG: response regulator transcription factor [Dehalococcoidia bacterium]
MAALKKDSIEVLVVDDDPKIRRLVAAHLKKAEYEPLLAANGPEALHQASLYQPSAIILDISMPGMDGFETLGRLREWYTEPVIILSATDLESEKVRALDLGADDYVTKPFGPDELLARVRASLRRAERLAVSEDVNEPLLRAGDIEVDLAARIVRKAGNEIRLTRTEYELLRELAVNAGKVLLHRQLLHSVWGPEYGEEAEYLRTFVKQLRRKLEKDPSRPTLIKTEPGVGYRFMADQPGATA